MLLRNRLARVDLDSDKGVLVTVALRRVAVQMNLEPPGRARSEFQLRYRPRNDPLFDVVTMQMNDRWLVRSPLQLNHIALCYSDELHVCRNMAVLDAQRIRHLGGMTDPFGRLIWSATGDPALLPSPYDAGWMLNRIADLPASQGSK